MKMKVKQLLEVYGRSAIHAGKGISQRIGSKGIGLSAKKDDNDVDFHDEKIKEISHAINTNPEWAKLMLPNMRKKLEYHQKRYEELTKKE